MAFSLRSANVVADHWDQVSQLLGFEQYLRGEHHIDLQAKGKRGVGAQTWPNAPQLLALNGLMKLKRVAPKSFITESVKTKNLPSLFNQLADVRKDYPIEVSEALCAFEILDWRGI
jgi:hypothetical protein